MAVYSTVDCCEVPGTLTESFDDERGLMKASVQVRVAWANRYALVADVCGARKAWPHGAPGPVPLAATASIVPDVGDLGATAGQEIAYTWGIVTLNYTTDIVEQASESIEPTVEFLTLDHKWFRWGSGSGDILQEDEAPGFLIRGLNYVRNELNVTSLHADLFDLPGCVNAAPVVASILGRTFAAETLLFAAPTISWKKDSSNVTKFDVTKKFTYNQHGWNAFFRCKTGQYENQYVVGASQPYKPYPVESFGNII